MFKLFVLEKVLRKTISRQIVKLDLEIRRNKIKGAPSTITHTILKLLIIINQSETIRTHIVLVSPGLNSWVFSLTIVVYFKTSCASSLVASVISNT